MRHLLRASYWIPLVAGLLALLTTGLLHRVLSAPELKLSNYLMRTVSPNRPDPRIILAGIDEKTIEQGKFNRPTHAQVLANLRDAGVTAVFYDVIFDEPRGDDIDNNLADALAYGDFAVVAGVLTRENSKIVYAPLIEPIEAVAQARLASIGIINSEQTDNQVSLAMVAVDIDGKHYPSAALAMLARINSQVSEDIEYRPEEGFLLVLPSIVPVELTPPYQPDEDPPETRYYKKLIVFHEPATGPGHTPGPATYPLLSYARLSDLDDPIFGQLRGAIVIVGDNTTGPTDLYQTPLGSMKGFEIHAQILDNLLNNVHIRKMPPLYQSINTAMLPLMLALISLVVRRAGRVVLLQLFFWVLYMGVNVLAFRMGSWFNMVEIGLTGLLTIGNTQLFRLMLWLKLLDRFIPKEVVNELLAAGKVADRSEIATVMVTDIRGYTTLSESRTPTEVLRMLNDYHTRTVAIYDRWGGRALTYQGDAQIVCFRRNRRHKDPAGSAIKAALEMQQSVDLLREQWGIGSRKEFDVGAAVCTGPVTIGEIGTGREAEFTVIGETVRLAHKVQSLSQLLSSNVLIDDFTMVSSKARLETVAFHDQVIEGVEEPTTVYRVIRADDITGTTAPDATGPSGPPAPGGG